MKRITTIVLAVSLGLAFCACVPKEEPAESTENNESSAKERNQ